MLESLRQQAILSGSLVGQQVREHLIAQLDVELEKIRQEAMNRVECVIDAFKQKVLANLVIKELKDEALQGKRLVIQYELNVDQLMKEACR